MHRSEIGLSTFQIKKTMKSCLFFPLIFTPSVWIFRLANELSRASVSENLWFYSHFHCQNDAAWETRLKLHCQNIDVFIFGVRGALIWNFVVVIWYGKCSIPHLLVDYVMGIGSDCLIWHIRPMDLSGHQMGKQWGSIWLVAS